MAVPFPIPPLVLVVVGGVFLFVLAGLSIGSSLAGPLRQAGYERVVRRELVRLEVILPASAQIDADATAELIRALHPGQRRGVGRFRVGWPPIELRVLWCDGAMHWQIDCPAQIESSVEMAVSSVLGRCELEEVEIDDLPPAAVATAKLARTQSQSLRTDAEAASVPLRLGVALNEARTKAEVVLRIGLMPGASSNSGEESIGHSIAGFILSAIVDAILMRSVADKPMPRAPARSTSAPTGMYSATVTLEASDVSPATGAALLWNLVGATDALRSGSQSLVWTVREGSKSGASPLSADPELLGALWALPGRRLDELGLERERALPGSHRDREGSGGIAIADARRGPLTLSTDTLARHLAVFGATGSGKTTLLLNLVLGCARNGVGVTVIDPHGDLTADILGRVPEDGPTVHVLRLADRAHPRGFNFLERRGDDDAQLVASEFVQLLADLWPRFCGPKMQHYLRHALFAAFADPDQQTILELIRILTNDRARMRYTELLKDPMERAFWRDEWPGPKEREHDPSIKAVLNKLGAFVSYESIRSIVGQGDSTISPRKVMDAGDVLVVDLSNVGGDNAALFGAMLVSRFLIDAVGRQGRPVSERRPHLLVVDEAQRFHTQAMEGILAEGRKFGLHIALAAQSLSALGERLAGAVRTNVASVALLEPGTDDVRDLGRLFAPVTAEELLAMRRFDVVVRTRGSDGTPHVRAGRVSMPGPADPERMEAVVAASDDRDAPLTPEEVEAEVFARSGGNEPPEPKKPAEAPRTELEPTHDGQKPTSDGRKPGDNGRRPTDARRPGRPQAPGRRSHRPARRPRAGDRH
jgi:Helicase HerA, central domain